MLQGTVIAGAAQIIAVDVAAPKLEAAQGLGATDVIRGDLSDAVEGIRTITAGRGADFTFEVVGSPDIMRQAYDAACRGGTVTFVGAMSSNLAVSFPANDLHSSSKRLLGSAYGSAQVRRHMPELVALAEAGRLDLATMVSQRLPLDQVNEAMQAMEGGEVVRSVLIP